MTKSKSKAKRADKSPVTKDGSESDSSKMGSIPQSPVSAVAPSSAAVTSSVTPTHHSSSQVTRPSPSVWFIAEIQQMMHGFGDCRRPLLECATIIEEVVHQQLTTMLYQAAEIGSARNARFTSLEDFLFLLRKDKHKLRRLVKYMTLKDMKASLKSGGMEEEEAQESTAEGKQPPKKKRKICYDFISSIDQTGELLAVFDDDTFDEIKHERALRAELQTRHMDAQQYLEFCEARQASFAPRYKSQKFRDWLMAGISLEPKPNPLAIEVLSYMAFETVAQIVELSLIVKRDMSGTVDDPFLQSMPTICVNHESVSGPQPATTPSRSPSRAPSPITSPPSTPTTTASAAAAVLSTPSASSQPAPNPSSGGSLSKSKSKKRKKSGSQTSRELYANQAIQPSHVREALRRYGQCLGPFADFSKQPMLCAKQRLFCA